MSGYSARHLYRCRPYQGGRSSPECLASGYLSGFATFVCNWLDAAMNMFLDHQGHWNLDDNHVRIAGVAYPEALGGQRYSSQKSPLRTLSKGST